MLSENFWNGSSAKKSRVALEKENQGEAHMFSGNPGHHSSLKEILHSISITAPPWPQLLEVPDYPEKTHGACVVSQTSDRKPKPHSYRSINQLI